MNAKRSKQNPTSRKNASETDRPRLWRSDSRPDPSSMSEAGRAVEFGRIIFRAIERKQAKAN